MQPPLAFTPPPQPVPVAAGLRGESLNAAFLEHRDQLYGFVLALVREPDLAEDVFQDVGLSVIQAAQKAESEAVQDFLPWARTLCRRRAADHIRRRRRLRHLEAPVADLGELVDRSFAENPVDPEDSTRRVHLLRRCLEHLAPKARSIVDARYLDLLDIGAIASRFGWKPNAIKVALAKARSHLFECLHRRMKALEDGDGT